VACSDRLGMEMVKSYGVMKMTLRTCDLQTPSLG
jgi:hypothetical protein